jgi:putative ABC transport system permease protein
VRPLAFAARSLRREFLHAELATLAAALVLAVAALAAVGTLAARVEGAILASAADLMGGDLGVASRQSIPDAFADEAARLGLRVGSYADFPSVVFATRPAAQAAAASAFCDIRASDTAFPLRGELVIRAADGHERSVHVPPPGTVYAEHRTLAALGIGIGGTVQVGGRPLQVAGEIVRTPDAGGLVRLAPRLVMNLADARASGLLGVGSRADHRLLVAGDPDAVSAFAAWAGPRLGHDRRLVTVADAQRNLERAFDRSSDFLALAALLAALLAGIAVALSAQRFARRKRLDVALLRCLGASRREILLALVLELALVALVACTLGWGLGMALQQAVFALVHDLVPAAPAPFPAAPGLAAWLIGAAVLFAFALPPLLRLREVAPMALFRPDAGARARRIDLLYLLPLALAALLIRLEAGDTGLAVTLGLALAGVALAALGAGWLLMAALRRLGRTLTAGWRFGLASLTRRRAQSLLQIGALALSLTALDVLAIVGPSLLDRWRLELPADTPNWFLLDIQPAERDAVLQRLRDDGADNVNALPLAVARLVAINGKPPQPAADDHGDDARDDGARTRQREVRLSWSATLPPSNVVREGRWFAPGDPRPAVSVDMRWVERYGLALGDRLTLQSGDRRIEAEVRSIRGVDWDSFRVNFFVMLDPATGAALPHGFIASLHLPDTRADVLAALTRDYPNISVIDVNAILARVRELIGHVGSAASWVLGFSLAAGLLVLAAALAATASERRHDMALLRTLGAHRAQLRAAVLGEFIALGGIAGVLGALGAAATGIALASRVFRLDAYMPPWTALAGAAVAGATLIAVAGWLGTRRIARTPPLAVLR